MYLATPGVARGTANLVERVFEVHGQEPAFFVDDGGLGSGLWRGC